MFYGRPIKTILDFEVKLYGHFSIALDHKRFCTFIVDTPIGFYITQNKLKMRKMCKHGI
jgi:hypothetical protein